MKVNGMTKQSTEPPGSMTKRPFISNAVPSITQLEDNHNPDEFAFARWHTRHVLNWLRGIDESVSTYLRLFTQNQLNGSFLNGLTDEQLRRLGITKEPARRLILQASNLLHFYVIYISRRTKYKQRMRRNWHLKVSVSVQNLMNAISLATPVINSPTQSSRSLVILNSVLMSVSEIHETITKLIFCLDRHPFDDKKEFIRVRNSLANYMKDMIEAINPNNKQFFAVPQRLVILSEKIQTVTRDLINSPDPHIIETPYIQRAVLYGYRSDEWGITFRINSDGKILITSVSEESLNFSAQRIHAGDEIVEINRQAIVGWKYANILKKMESAAREGAHGFELDITLCKRPRESWVNLTLQKPRSQSPTAEKRSEDRKKMMLDFKQKIQPDVLSRHSLNSSVVRRGRSASFSDNRDLRKQSSFEDENVRNEPLFSVSASNRVPTSLITFSDKRPLFRRASVWSESPPAILRSPFDRLHAAESNAWLLLLASWGDVSKARNGYIHSRPTPRLPLQKEGNTIDEENEEMNLESEYEDVLLDESNIYIATNAEIEALDIKTPTTEDADWSVPAREDITGCKIAIRVHLERGSSVSNVDSPLSNIHAKITKFLYGTDAEQQQNNSMSTSFSDKAEGSGTPITPLSKVFQDLVFSTPSKIQQQFSPVTVDSPSSISRSISPQLKSNPDLSRVMNIVTKRTRLAPLAEPDDDLDENEQDTCGLPTKSISSDDMFQYLQNSLEKCAKIPVNDLIDKLQEGWIRRQRITDDELRTPLTKNNSQWVKCWLVLTKSHLLVYTNQNSKEADIVFDTMHFSTFEIVWNNGRLCFAAYTSIDSSSWTQWISEQCAAFGQEKNSHLNPVYVRSVDSDSSSSNTDGRSKSSRISQLKPVRILSRLSRRSFSRPHHYTTISSGTPSSPISNIVPSQEVATS
ncbi:hypothetical protein M3Y97_00860400 [Aphelenchoides bicaudatus]|nr:hypothetical protein M3Y97_00860400 [Aphelenchoides bicaudatus]